MHGDLRALLCKARLSAAPMPELAPVTSIDLLVKSSIRQHGCRQSLARLIVTLIELYRIYIIIFTERWSTVTPAGKRRHATTAELPVANANGILIIL